MQGPEIQEVYDERQKVESDLKDVQEEVKTVLSIIDIIEQEKRLLKAHQSTIEDSKHFSYRVKVQKCRKVDLAGTGTLGNQQ